jgi:prepilin-type N-terminal cleavage/methylation domain-containing protein
VPLKSTRTPEARLGYPSVRPQLGEKARSSADGRSSATLIKNEAGYSLVEVMVSIMILAIAIIPMVGMFDAGLNAAAKGGNYDRARAIAGQELEEIRALPFRVDPNPPEDSAVEFYPPVNGPSGGAPVACTGPIDAAYDCLVETTYVSVGSSSVSPDSSARTMMQVRVTVTWDGGSASYTRTGLISKETRCAIDC